MSKVLIRNDFIKKTEERGKRVSKVAAEAVADRARSLAPVRTGELRGSITTKEMSDGSVAVGATAPHAAVVEYGSSRRAPQPYLRPALDSLKSNPPILDK